MALQEDFVTPLLVWYEFTRWTNSKVMKWTVVKYQQVKRLQLYLHADVLQDRKELWPLLVKTGLFENTKCTDSYMAYITYSLTQLDGLPAVRVGDDR